VEICCTVWIYIVTQLVLALHYKTGHGFDSLWCHWNFSLTYSFWPHYGPGVNSASNRNEYQEYFLADKGGRCIGLTTLPPSCPDCVEIWEPQAPGILCACNRPVQVLLYLLPRLLRTITNVNGIDTEWKGQHTYTIQLSAQLHKFVCFSDTYFRYWRIFQIM